MWNELLYALGLSKQSTDQRLAMDFVKVESKPVKYNDYFQKFGVYL